MNHRFIATMATASVSIAGAANAANVNVSADITTSVTWTADNVYNLTEQIYVQPGASLTIEAGTVIASTPTANGSGSLAVTRGGKIFANGTQESPIIFTSTNDTATWVDGDPKTGTWREAANEWGNLTIMGRAYVSNSFVDGNSATFGNNESPMEGLIPDFAGDPNTIYGGTDDDYSAGALAYVSIRYGGRVVGLANELNGLSLGGIGRGTDIDHIEIMNNVDDGIEIWGGTVNLRYVNIWNIGDDSFDIDQGWRGSAQNGLIVQGYSLDAGQGSGVGDNMCETDGAENSDAQPVTTAQIANFTLVGQPIDGDGATVWRDGARVQYNQCIIMDCGEKVVRPDGDDGDGAAGYGFNGTLTLAQVFTTPYTSVSTVNAGGIKSAGGAGSLYTAQTSGFLAQIADSVLYNNSNYADFDAFGQNAASKENVIEPGTMPITSIVRDMPVIRGGKVMQRVSSINPMPQGAATSAVGMIGANGFVEETSYRGGFAPNENWLCGWTAAEAFGMVDVPVEFCVEQADCPTDLNGDGVTSGADVGIFLSMWGTDDPAGDFDGNGIVGGADFGILLAAFGPCV